MQPYFFPYIGYFSLIKHTNQFVLLDEVQFLRRSWMTRNRILNQNDSWVYIRVPIIKMRQKTLIKNIVIDNRVNWKRSLLAQLEGYKKIAPNYFPVISIVKELLENEYTNIVRLNKDSLTLVCDYLNIQADIDILSEMSLKIEKPNAPDEWPLNICKAIGNVGEYWNPLSGIDIYNNCKYYQENIKLLFLDVNIEAYNQNRETFIPRLSILDVMMFNSIENINKMLDNYTLVSKQ